MEYSFICLQFCILQNQKSYEMKKLTFLTILISFLAISTYGQITLIEENFDSFAAGSKIVQTINDQSVWDTWSSTPGGSEDALISDKYSNSPNNSIYLANNNDIVLLFDDLTSGRYQVKFKILIESGKIGYFNMLHDFAGGNSQWAFQVYFNPNGMGVVDAGRPSAASFNFGYDKWMDVNVVVDLDDDFASFYFDEKEIISWKWSLGTSGGGTLTKLDAVNFYGITQGGSSGMYIDDVYFIEQVVPEAPSNLTASVENDKDIALNWDAPTVLPDNYILSRNNVVIASDLVNNSFTESPYPGENTYTVRAHTLGLGYSHSSNEASATIPGGFDREYVLFEIGTGTGCPYCPGASMGAVDMVENGDNVIVVKYHNFNSSDPFNNPVSAERASTYYQISGYPTSFADGTLSLSGGSANNSLFETYHQHYLQRKERKALYTIDVNVFNLAGNDYRAEISIREHSNYIDEEKTLHTAVTETDIDYPWQNQDKVHWTCRNMFPDAKGTKVDFSTNPIQELMIDFSLEDGWVKENCEFVVFLQADPSKEVMVATKVDLADILLNKPVVKDTELQVYPNPASDMLYLNQQLNSDYHMIDISGRTVLKGHLGNQIDVSELSEGLYLLYIEGKEVIKVTIN